MSRHTRRSKVLDADEPEFGDEAADFFQDLDDRMGQPWSVITPAIDRIRRRWSEIQQSLPDPITDYEGYARHFVERETEVWYLRTAVQSIAAAERAIAVGSHGNALRFAFEVGDLMCEYALKDEWGQLAAEGEKARAARALGAANRRINDATLRVAAVERHLADGASKTRAYVKAAAELGCSPSVVKGDYSKRTKVGLTSG